jgi:hypothetical protein
MMSSSWHFKEILGKSAMPSRLYVAHLACSEFHKIKGHPFAGTMNISLQISKIDLEWRVLARFFELGSGESILALELPKSEFPRLMFGAHQVFDRSMRCLVCLTVPNGEQ